MSVVIVGMHEKALEKNESLKTNIEIESRLLRLDEYLSIAEKIIGHFASPRVANDMLNDEDAISFIAEHLIKGDIRWKPELGRTLYSYRNQCGIWAIKRWLLNKKTSTKNHVVSLDKNWESQDEDKTIYSFVADKTAPTPSQDGNLNVEEMIDKDYLTDIQKKCLKMKYIDGMTFRAIGESLGKTGSRIEQIVSKAVSLLREEYVQKNN